MTVTIEELQAENTALQQRVAELEHALSQSQQQVEQLNSIQETVADWVWEIDTNGHYTYVSPNITNVLGYDPDEVVGKTPFDFMPPEEAERVTALFVSLAANPQPIHFLENVKIHKDGHQVVQEANGIPLYDTNRVLCGYRGLDRDITQRRQAEMERDQLFTITPDLISISGFDGYFRRLNPSWERMLGFTEEELYAEPFIHLVHPDDRQTTLDAVQQLTKGRSVINFTNRYRCKDGSYRWIEWTAVTVPEQQSIYAVAREITERKQREDDLRIFKAAIENAIDGIGMANNEGCITYANASYSNLTGYGQAIIGMALDTIYDVDRSRIETIMQHVMEHGYWTGSLSIVHKEGCLIPVQASVFPVHDEQGNISGTVAIVRDMQEQQRAEAERIALQQQVIDAQQEALRELSTPLIPIANQVLVMPLIGSINSTRAQMVMEALLEGVARYQATLVILDITGVQVVDTQVANTFVQMAQATKLLGAQVVITGIQPPIAQTLIHLGVDLHGIVTRSTLQAGIEYALVQRSQQLNGTTH